MKNEKRFSKIALLYDHYQVQVYGAIWVECDIVNRYTTCTYSVIVKFKLPIRSVHEKLNHLCHKECVKRANFENL